MGIETKMYHISRLLQKRRVAACREDSSLGGESDDHKDSVEPSIFSHHLLAARPDYRAFIELNLKTASLI